VADGFMFVIQNVGPNALGANSGGLGFSGMYPSMGVKFDLYNNGGGANTTGLYVSGDYPSTPATALGGGVNILDGDIFNVTISYDGTTLTMTITDATAGGSFTTSWPINIPKTVLGNTAYVGFTGSTGSKTAVQQILNWTYTTDAALPAAAPPVIMPATGEYASTQSVTVTDTTSGSTIYYTTDGTPPTTASPAYTGMFNVNATTTVNAIAVAPQYANSAAATSVITIP
jgi:hypothetical protein